LRELGAKGAAGHDPVGASGFGGLGEVGLDVGKKGEDVRGVG